MTIERLTLAVVCLPVLVVATACGSQTAAGDSAAPDATIADATSGDAARSDAATDSSLRDSSPLDVMLIDTAIDTDARDARNGLDGALESALGDASDTSLSDAETADTRSGTDTALGDSGQGDGAIPSLCPVPTTPQNDYAAYFFDGNDASNRVLAYGIAVHGDTIAINSSRVAGNNGGYAVNATNITCSSAGLELEHNANPPHGRWGRWQANAGPAESTANVSFGRGLAYTDDGRLIIGYAGFDAAFGVDVGQVQVFRPEADGYVQTQDFRGVALGTTRAMLGSSIVAAGSLLFVGSIEIGQDPAVTPGTGLVSVYRRIPGSDSFAPIEPSGWLRNPNSARDDGFGCGLAVDGNRLFVGACAEDAGATADVGHVYEYEFSISGDTINFELVRDFGPPTVTASLLFGRALLVANGHLFVGAPGIARDGVANVGGVYQYTLSAGAPTYDRQVVEGQVSAWEAPARGSNAGRSLAYWRGYLIYGMPTAHNGWIGWKWIGS